jgi:NADPH2 dehydrogenase
MEKRTHDSGCVYMRSGCLVETCLKQVVERVHAKGSYIYLQLWAIGRAAEPDVIHTEGYPYVSSSSTLLEGRSEAPQELTKEDIKRYVGLYVQAAKNAVHKAGFNGVEIHAAK